jgi:hypothetical protein
MRVGHPMQRDIADDQTVDALVANLTQIVARVRLRATARNVCVEHQHVQAHLFELGLRGLD